MIRSVPKMANPIGSRLKTEMKKRGITSAELAKRADVKTSFIYDVISGKSANPSTVKLARVAESLGINLSTLVESGLVESKTSGKLSSIDYVTIPRLRIDTPSHGKPAVISESEDGSYSFRMSWIRDRLDVHPADLRVLTVSGDNMEPTLCHNDTLLIDTSRKAPTPPGVFVLLEGYGLVIKRLELLTQGRSSCVRLVSDNPQYSIYERSPEDISIIGRVVWFGREI